MTEIKKRYYKPSEDIFAGRPPELMTEPELTDAYDRLMKALSQQKDVIIATAKDVEETVENVGSGHKLWKTRAVLLSLVENIVSLDKGPRDTVLSYLLDMMFYGERSIRKCAAMTAGMIIASVCEEDMSIWADLLHKLLFMKADRPAGSRGLSEDPLRIILTIVYGSSEKKTRKLILNQYASFFKSTRWDSFTCLRLISGIFMIPVKEWGAMQRGNIGGFIRYFLKQDDIEVRIASLFLLNEWLEQGWSPSEDFAGFLKQAFKDIYEKDRDTISPAANVLIREISIRIGISEEIICNPAPLDRELYSSNMRADQSWIFKLVNLRILKQRYADASPEDPGFVTYVSQLMILLRLNPDEIVFHRAGDDILDIIDRISGQQKYEMVKELFKVIETGYDETGYVPGFLGRFFGRLDTNSQVELLSDIQELCAGSDENIVGSTLETVCFMLRELIEQPTGDDERLILVRKLCGLISQGMYSDLSDMVSRNLFSFGYDLFGYILDNDIIPDERISDCLVDVARDALICMKNSNYPDVLCHTLPVKYISQLLDKVKKEEGDSRPVAFFSSSFDPFSNGHRAIVREIAEMGYQVYVNVHDFAQDRNMQPMLVRRQMAAMSVTDMTHVQLFPEEISINTENPEDLARLKGLFPGQKVWLVIGSDRIANDEIYREEPEPGSVHSFPHIIFVRNETSDYFDLNELNVNLTGDVIELKLPVYYEHMTSYEVRKDIQEGKSIEELVGLQVKNFIARHNLYTDNRMFKPDVAIDPVDTVTDKDSCTICIVADGKSTPVGKITFTEVTDENGESGFSIDALELTCEQNIYGEILLDETVIALQERDRHFITCRSNVISSDMLIRRGFVNNDADDIYTVCMDEPIVLFTDLTSFIIDNLDDAATIMDTARENARRLERAAAELFPGNLILTIHSELLNYRLSKKIRDFCISDEKNSICVPFGRILKYVSIPGVFMLPLNTEKRYTRSLDSFEICEKPGYNTLAEQIRTIKSKNLPFVLVDDLYHKGYRMDKIITALKSEGMREERLIVGVRSDKGAELAALNGINIDPVYNIPNLRLWINASDMIPFYGSDKIDPGKELAGREMDDYPSIYPMLPYQFPSFLKEAPYEAVYRLSEVCMENAIRLFGTLERLYRVKYHRMLTFARLSEVIDDKGYPENTGDPETIMNKTVCELLETELEKLRRLKKDKSS